MKPISDHAIEVLEEVALDGAAQIKAFFAHDGTDAAFLQKAKLGAVAISGYARVRQSETGRMMVAVAMKRLEQ